MQVGNMAENIILSTLMIVVLGSPRPVLVPFLYIRLKRATHIWACKKPLGPP